MPLGEFQRQRFVYSKGTLLPPEYLKRFLEEDKSLPVPDAVFGFDDDAESDKPAEIPSVDELLEDPDVKAVFEASKGLKPVAA